MLRCVETVFIVQLGLLRCQRSGPDSDQVYKGTIEGKCIRLFILLVY
jgi:hypothetical protein